MSALWRWRDTSLRMGLLAFSAVFTGAMVLIGALGIYGSRQALRSMDDLYTRDAQAVEALAGIRSDMLDAVVTSRTMLDAWPGQRTGLLATANNFIGAAQRNWASYKMIPQTAGMEVLARDFEQRFLAALHAEGAQDTGRAPQPPTRCCCPWRPRWANASASQLATCVPACPLWPAGMRWDG